MDLTNLSSNWKKLQASLAKSSSPANTTTTTNSQTSSDSHFLSRPRPHHDLSNFTPNRKRKRHEHPPPPTTNSLSSSSHLPSQHKKHQSTRPKPMSSPTSTSPLTTTTITSAPPSASSIPSAPASSSSLRNSGLHATTPIGTYIALDCEMVGLAPDGVTSILARISIVNYEGQLIYDSYVLPQRGQIISDYRTAVSGIRPRDLNTRTARPFAEVQAQVQDLISGRVVVGHALRHDWAVLGIEHPRENVRDTCKHRPYRKLVGGGTPGLKLLVGLVLGVDVQEGEHCSLEDARAAMALFRREQGRWVVERQGENGKRGKSNREKDGGRRGKWK